MSIGIYITKKSYNYGGYGLILSILSGIYLVLHVIMWSIASYEYEVFVAKRNAFVETLTKARKNNNVVELAAITKEISEWNQQLSVAKYNLTVFMIKDYTDKRISDLQPIH